MQTGESVNLGTQMTWNRMWKITLLKNSFNSENFIGTQRKLFMGTRYGVLQEL